MWNLDLNTTHTHTKLHKSFYNYLSPPNMVSEGHPCWQVFSVDSLQREYTWLHCITHLFLVLSIYSTVLLSRRRLQWSLLWTLLGHPHERLYGGIMGTPSGAHRDWASAATAGVTTFLSLNWFQPVALASAHKGPPFQGSASILSFLPNHGYTRLF